MGNKVQFELVSPERLLFSEAVDMVVVPGGEGDFGVLPKHSPLLATVRPGVIDIHDHGKVERRIFVVGGFAEVTPDRCTVLAEEAIDVRDITPEYLENRKRAAEIALQEAETDLARKAAELEIEIARAMALVK